MSILLITTTRGRPRAFAALQQWVAKQSTDNFDWLIVCDEPEGYKFPKGKTYHIVKRDPDNDTLPSIHANWLCVLDFIDAHPEFDRFIVLEDDDWYHKEYVYQTSKLLNESELAGWNEDAYYYVFSRRAKRCHNVDHASLACTAFKRSVVPYLREVVQTLGASSNVFLDLALWRGITETTLQRQPPLRLPDGSSREAEPVPYVRLVTEFKGKKCLADNFTGIHRGSREAPALDRFGVPKGSFPRHVGLKEPWHSGLAGLSEFGHTASGGEDIWGRKLKEWLGEEDAAFFLKMVTLTNHTGQVVTENGPYPAGALFSMPIEADIANY